MQAHRVVGKACLGVCFRSDKLHQAPAGSFWQLTQLRSCLGPAPLRPRSSRTGPEARDRAAFVVEQPLTQHLESCVLSRPSSTSRWPRVWTPLCPCRSCQARSNARAFSSGARDSLKSDIGVRCEKLHPMKQRATSCQLLHDESSRRPTWPGSDAVGDLSRADRLKSHRIAATYALIDTLRDACFLALHHANGLACAGH